MRREPCVCEWSKGVDAAQDARTTRQALQASAGHAGRRAGHSALHTHTFCDLSDSLPRSSGRAPRPAAAMSAAHASDATASRAAAAAPMPVAGGRVAHGSRSGGGRGATNSRKASAEVTTAAITHAHRRAERTAASMLSAPCCPPSQPPPPPPPLVEPLVPVLLMARV